MVATSMGCQPAPVRRQEGEQAECGDSALRHELAQLQARRMLRTLAVVQDLADALLALNDVRGARRGPSGRLRIRVYTAAGVLALPTARQGSGRRGAARPEPASG